MSREPFPPFELSEIVIDLFDKSIEHFFANPMQRAFDVDVTQNPQTGMVKISVYLNDKLTVTNESHLSMQLEPPIARFIKQQVQNAMDPGLFLLECQKTSELLIPMVVH